MGLKHIIVYFLMGLKSVILWLSRIWGRVFTLRNTLYVLLFSVYFVLLEGFLLYSIEGFNQGSLDHVFFFITISFTLAGLTSLGGIIGKSEVLGDFKLKFLYTGVIFLVSGLLFLFSISLAFYGLSGSNIESWWLTISAGDFVRFGAVLYVLSMAVFVPGTFYFLDVLVRYTLSIRDGIKKKNKKTLT